MGLESTYHYQLHFASSFRTETTLAPALRKIYHTEEHLCNRSRYLPPHCCR